MRLINVIPVLIFYGVSRFFVCCPSFLVCFFVCVAYFCISESLSVASDGFELVLVLVAACETSLFLGRFLAFHELSIQHLRLLVH